MASERAAHRAREQHAEFLRQRGAHAIAVDEIRRGGKPTFGVVAYFERKPAGLPETLAVGRGKTRVTVPLAVRVTKRFRPERA